MAARKKKKKKTIRLNQWSIVRFLCFYWLGARFFCCFVTAKKKKSNEINPKEREKKTIVIFFLFMATRFTYQSSLLEYVARLANDIESSRILYSIYFYFFYGNQFEARFFQNLSERSNRFPSWDVRRKSRDDRGEMSPKNRLERLTGSTSLNEKRTPIASAAQAPS